MRNQLFLTMPAHELWRGILIYSQFLLEMDPAGRVLRQYGCQHHCIPGSPDFLCRRHQLKYCRDQEFRSPEQNKLSFRGLEVLFLSIFQNQHEMRTPPARSLGTLYIWRLQIHPLVFYNRPKRSKPRVCILSRQHNILISPWSKVRK